MISMTYRFLQRVIESICEVIFTTGSADEACSLGKSMRDSDSGQDTRFHVTPKIIVNHLVISSNITFPFEPVAQPRSVYYHKTFLDENSINGIAK